MDKSALFYTISILLFVSGCSSIDDSCIKCLCEAVSNGPYCDYKRGCQNDVCGPYAITLPYWIDGGRLTVVEGGSEKSMYQKCALDFTCSVRTIRGYMDRYEKDCNKDSNINCYDYAAIHFYGPFDCAKPLQKPVHTALKNCLESSSTTTTSPEPLDENIIPDIDIRIGQDENLNKA